MLTLRIGLLLSLVGQLQTQCTSRHCGVQEDKSIALEGQHMHLYSDLTNKYFRKEEEALEQSLKKLETVSIKSTFNNFI